MNVGSHGTNVQPGHNWVSVKNESWPPAEVARRMTPLSIDQQIAVRVRVVFETGEEWLEGFATRWTKNLPHVRVAIHDERVASGGVWVAPEDIKRM